MDLESHRRWYDYSRARDAMFAATDTLEAPWYVIDSEDQEAGAAELPRAPAQPDPLQRYSEQACEAAQAPGRRGLCRANWRRHAIPEVY